MILTEHPFLITIKFHKQIDIITSKNDFKKYF